MAVSTCLESSTDRSIDAQLLARMRAEYVDLPGLKLTPPQAQRLWGLDRTTCEAALTALVEAKFLARTGTDLFVRAATVRRDEFE